MEKLNDELESVMKEVDLRHVPEDQLHAAGSERGVQSLSLETKVSFGGVGFLQQLLSSFCFFRWACRLPFVMARPK